MGTTGARTSIWLVGFVQQGIEGITDAVRADELHPDDALDRLARLVEPRGSQLQRRRDGSYFTATDVAEWLTRRALAADLLEVVGMSPGGVAHLLASGADLHAALDAAISDEAAHARTTQRCASIRVLDPTCGAGSFLVAAWRELLQLQRLLDDAARRLGIAPGPRIAATQLHGVDRDASAIAACRASLRLLIDDDRDAAAEPQLVVGDATAAGVLPPADIVLGNPPFVRGARADAPADLATAAVPNVSAWVVERALSVLRPGGRIAMVLPVSTVCTSAFAPARAVWQHTCPTAHVSTFDAIPATLFPGVVQRIALVEGAAIGEQQVPAGWHTSRYHRWTAAERPGLLDRVRFVPMPTAGAAGSLPKVGSAVELSLLERVRSHPPAGRFLRHGDDGDNVLHYKRRWSYFLLFTDFIPPMWGSDGEPREPTEFKTLGVAPELDAHALLAVYSSSLFWWHFSVFTDNRNVNVRDLAGFPVPSFDSATRLRLAQLGRELMVELRACAEVRTCTYRSIGTIRNTYFRQGATRPVLDLVDAELARAYGMDDEQLAFVLGFERRFRS
ncbi:MAG: hypothetical protein JWO69_1180 [Thermoleophilia bacterium]|nr:hypothetical protein [Thermoleophilia bacterium]